MLKWLSKVIDLQIQTEQIEIKFKNSSSQKESQNVLSIGNKYNLYLHFISSRMPQVINITKLLRHAKLLQKPKINLNSSNKILFWVHIFCIPFISVSWRFGKATVIATQEIGLNIFLKCVTDEVMWVFYDTSNNTSQNHGTDLLSLKGLLRHH